MTGSSDLRFGNRIHVDGWDNRSWIDFRVQACMQGYSLVEVHSCRLPVSPVQPSIIRSCEKYRNKKKDAVLEGLQDGMATALTLGR